ncbi:MAG: YggS family pyridoxal phosphate-dependent enzyme [Candidatus Omnitrophica bacterium]|nr:YggS family pyridoxal phosphate-dependent enzyme [Candidatus Omnitrophota bacterium]
MICDNITKTKNRIATVCLKVKRDPAAIQLLAVTKNRSIEEIQGVISAGITDLGENRVQEALLKYQSIKGVKWHMVGHLQMNKVRDAVKVFEMIQSVDSLRLAREINKEALKLNKIQDVLFEVKISPELTKFGINIEGLPEIIEEVAKLNNLNICGLMSIAPIADSAEYARPYFRKLRELRDKVNKSWILSIGMSDDFEVAIEEGSDMVRIGRAIFD